MLAVAAALPFAASMPQAVDCYGLASSDGGPFGNGSPANVAVPVPVSDEGCGRLPVIPLDSSDPCDDVVPAAQGEAPRADAPWDFPIIGLRYQRPFLWTSARSDHATSEERLFDIADAVFCADASECHVFAVWPQPYIPAPVFLVSLPWAACAKRIPVCLQVFRYGDAPMISQEYLDEMCFFQDLCELLPQHLQPGVRFWIGDSTAPVDPYDTLHVCPGLLIRVFPESIQNPRRPFSLSLRLQHMFDEFSDLAADGPPELDVSGFRIGLLQPAELPMILEVSEDNREEIVLTVARALHRPRESFQLLDTGYAMEPITLLGLPVSRVMAVLPPDISNYVPVFVDPRAVAQHVRIVLLPPVPLAVTDFLRTSHVLVPEGHKPVLAGTSAVQSCLPRLRFYPRDIIRVSVLVDDADSVPPDCEDLGDDGAEPDRERTPRRPVASAPVPSPPLSSATGVPGVACSIAGAVHSLGAEVMWNWGPSQGHLCLQVPIPWAQCPAYHTVYFGWQCCHARGLSTADCCLSY